MDHLFEVDSWPPPSTGPTLDRHDLTERLLRGGFPEVVTEGLTSRQRQAWFETYVGDVVSREAVRPLAEIRVEGELRRMLALLAARTGQELVQSDLAADSQLDRATVANYVSLLQALHLVVLVPAWSRNVTTRAKRSPKIALVDTGLAAGLTRTGAKDFAVGSDGRAAGALFESFVTTEILKQCGWSERTVDVSHYRDRNGPEIDVIVEDRHTGEVAAVEVKLTSTPMRRQTQHLAMLRDRLGHKFTTGVLVHAGTHTLGMGERLWAVPVSALWRDDPAPDPYE